MDHRPKATTGHQRDRRFRALPASSQVAPGEPFNSSTETTWPAARQQSTDGEVQETRLNSFSSCMVDAPSEGTKTRGPETTGQRLPTAILLPLLLSGKRRSKQWLAGGVRLLVLQPQRDKNVTREQRGLPTAPHGRLRCRLPWRACTRRPGWSQSRPA